MSTTQGIKIDEDIQSRLKKLGALRERSPHWLMKTAIIEYLEREEQREREKQEDQERWNHYLLTGEAIGHEQVTPWLEELAQGKRTPWQK